MEVITRAILSTVSLVTLSLANLIASDGTFYSVDHLGKEVNDMQQLHYRLQYQSYYSYNELIGSW